ncbi:MAG: GIY-YIG nuclease family protein [Verrucomicrobia bacterium]|nr:GIY-YIG nuclease family protein [Verrucomicrobiota bacterium]
MKPKTNPAIAEITAKMGVTKRHARRILAESKASGSNPDELYEAKRRKMVAQADKVEHELAEMRAKHISTDQVKAEGRELYRVWERDLKKWASTLPKKLEGQTAAQMAEVLGPEVYGILCKLSGSEP